MKTKQKAREWLVPINKSIAPTTTEKEAKELIIALLLDCESLLAEIERLSELSRATKIQIPTTDKYRGVK